MKLGLGHLENSRTFYSPKGNQTVIRDTFTPQFDPPQQESIKEIKLKIEEVTTDQSFEEVIVDKTFEEVIEENILIKNRKNKNERPTKN
jgi:hypothetical protein